MNATTSLVRTVLRVAVLITVCVIHVEAQSWMAGPNSLAGHYRGTSVLLQNGAVLIIGGFDASNNATVDCELYNPLTNTLQRAGSMSTARAWHSAVVLRDGRVLVIGGYTGSTLATCELYNPATDRWTPTDSLSTSRSRTVATLLNDGRVLVSGGYHSQGASVICSDACEIYDPANGRWTKAASMAVGRSSHAGVLLPNGKVFIAGGYNYSPVCELYDPATNKWSTADTLKVRTRGEHSLTLLTNGKVLLAGGWGGTLGMFRDCALYDPAANKWAMTDSLTTPRAAHRTFLLPNGMVLAAGGHNALSNADQSCFSVATCEIYNPSTGRWSPGPTLPVETSYFAATLLPSGFAWCGVGGRRNVNLDPEFLHSTTSLLDYSRLGTVDSAIVPGGHTMASAMLLPNGTAMLLGGSSSCSTPAPLTSVALYDYRSNQWSATPISLPSIEEQTVTLLAGSSPLAIMVGGRDVLGVTSATTVIDWSASTAHQGPPLRYRRMGHSATLLPTGQLLVLGGASDPSGAGVAATEVFDGTRWDTAAPMPAPRFHHTATLLPDGRVLVAGGQYSNASRMCMMYDPRCDRWSAVPSMHTERASHTATLLANGTVLVTGGIDSLGRTVASSETYDPIANAWTLTANLGLVRSHHSATMLPSGNVVISGGSDGSGFSIPAVEMYSPLTRAFTPALSPVTPGTDNASVLLPDGSVLVAGGRTLRPFGCSDALISYRIAPDFGFAQASRPAISALHPQHIATPVGDTLVLQIDGSGFRDNNRQTSEGCTGDYNSSPFNYPVVQIRRIGGDRFDNDETMYAPFDFARARWSDASTQVRIPLGIMGARRIPAGWYAVTVISNGIPSTAAFTRVDYDDAPLTRLISLWHADSGCGTRAFTITSFCTTPLVAFDTARSHGVSVTFTPTGIAGSIRVEVTLIDHTQGGRFTITANGGTLLSDSIAPFPLTASVLEAQKQCAMYSVDLELDCGIESIALDPATSRNVVISHTPALPSPQARASIRLLDSSQDGVFTLVVNGVSILRDSLQQTRTMALLSAVPAIQAKDKGTRCDSIEIGNIGRRGPLVITAAQLRANIAFSLPPSQFPITIPVGERRALVFCFQPGSDTVAFDTLLIHEECQDLALPLVAHADRIYTGVAIDCGSQIGFHPARPGSFSVKAATPRLESGGTVVAIDIELLTGGEHPRVAAHLYTADGAEVRQVVLENWSGGQSSLHGTIRIDASDLAQGYYVVTIAGGEDVIGYPLVLVR